MAYESNSEERGSPDKRNGCIMLGDKMKCKKNVSFFCTLTAGIILLSACSQNTELNTEKAKDTNKAETTAGTVYTDFENNYVAVSEDGYYFWEGVSGGRLMFMDRKSGKTVPLCNKPDCTHEDRDWNCNASFQDPGYQLEADGMQGDGIDHNYLMYYEDSLYAVGCDPENYAALYRIKPDGSGEWEKCARLYKTDYSSTGHWKSLQTFFIDDGRVYYVDRNQESQQLVSMDLDGEDREVIFESEEGMTAEVYRLKKNGNYLYYQVLTYEGEDYENYEGGLYQYDPAAGKSSMVKEMLVVPYSVRGDQIYYGNEEGLCCYSMKNQTTEVLNDTSIKMPYITLTEEYIAIFDYDGRELTLYHYDGEEIVSVCDENMSMCWGGDSQRLFGETSDAEQSSCWTTLDITNTSGDMEWKR